MYKILKFNWEDRHKHFFTSDWHVYHDPKTWTSPIWEMRGYSDAFHASEEILRTINENVPEDGILWSLGDMFLNATDEQCIDWLSRVKCRQIYALWGNHESQMFRIYRNMVADRTVGLTDCEVYPFNGNLLPNVTFLGNHQEIQIGKKQIIMNHFPLRIWHNDGRSSWMLSGHSHLQDAGRRPDAATQKGLDIGWDYKNNVWTFAEIEDVMSTKSVHILDHNRDH